MIIQITLAIKNTKACVLRLRVQLNGLTGPSPNIYKAYDNCIILDACKLARIRLEMISKYADLQKELRIEKNGMGSFYTNRKLFLSVNYKLLLCIV